MAVKIIDKIVEFAKNNASAMDIALNSMAIDILRIAKTQVPVSATKAMGNRRGGGQLQSSGLVRRRGLMRYSVEFNKEYAAYQEWGGDGKRVVKRYSTPGTKKFYLRDPALLVASRALVYIGSEAKKVNVNL